MQADHPQPLELLRADGGAAANDFLLQFQADMLGCRIERPACMESTAQGAAALAALALGWQTPASLAGRAAERTFTPAMPDEQRRQRLAGWREAVARARNWARPE